MPKYLVAHIFPFIFVAVPKKIRISLRNGLLSVIKLNLTQLRTLRRQKWDIPPPNYKFLTKIKKIFGEK